MKPVLFLLLLSVALPAFAQDGLPSQPYVYAKGKAEIEKTPDMVTIQFGIVTHNIDQGKANAEVQGKATKILTMLNSRKIDEKDVIAGDIKSDPEYERDETNDRGRGKLIGYTVRRTFNVKLKDL